MTGAKHKEEVMAEAKGLSGLKLSVEEREKVADMAGELIAVQVYRELQRASAAVKASDSGCNIIGNCSSSCKARVLEEFAR
jgi:hypothetical protein